MRKGRLKTGAPFLGIKIEVFVEATEFAKALADHCYYQGIEFDPKIKRSEAKAILKKRLFFHGITGEFDWERYDQAAEEVVEPFRTAYNLAKVWVLKNYPYLAEKDKDENNSYK